MVASTLDLPHETIGQPTRLSGQFAYNDYGVKSYKKNQINVIYCIGARRSSKKKNQASLVWGGIDT